MLVAICKLLACITLHRVCTESGVSDLYQVDACTNSESGVKRPGFAPMICWAVANPVRLGSKRLTMQKHDIKEHVWQHKREEKCLTDTGWLSKKQKIKKQKIKRFICFAFVFTFPWL